MCLLCYARNLVRVKRSARKKKVDRLIFQSIAQRLLSP